MFRRDRLQQPHKTVALELNDERDPRATGIVGSPIQRSMLKVALSFFLFHASLVIIVNDATLTFGVFRQQHFLNDLRQRRCLGLHSTCQRIATQRSKANDFLFGLLTREKFKPIIIHHDGDPISGHHRSFRGKVKWNYGLSLIHI